MKNLERFKTTYVKRKKYINIITFGFREKVIAQPVIRLFVSICGRTRQPRKIDGSNTTQSVFIDSFDFYLHVRSTISPLNYKMDAIGNVKNC